MRKAGSVCAKVELEEGGCCPGQMGEKHWGARVVHTLEKEHCQPPETRLEHAKRPWAEAQGAREEAWERVLQQDSKASTWPEAQPNALLPVASGACHPA